MAATFGCALLTTLIAVIAMKLNESTKSPAAEGAGSQCAPVLVTGGQRYTDRGVVTRRPRTDGSVTGRWAACGDGGGGGAVVGRTVLAGSATTLLMDNRLFVPAADRLTQKVKSYLDPVRCVTKKRRTDLTGIWSTLRGPGSTNAIHVPFTAGVRVTGPTSHAADIYQGALIEVHVVDASASRFDSSDLDAVYSNGGKIRVVVHCESDRFVADEMRTH